MRTLPSAPTLAMASVATVVPAGALTLRVVTVPASGRTARPVTADGATAVMFNITDETFAGVSGV